MGSWIGGDRDGILGPVVVNYMREYQLSLGMPRDQVYNTTMYILIGVVLAYLISQQS